MDDKVRINIQVGENKHPLFVRRDEEPIYRDAARMVNERYHAYAKKYRGADLPQDYLMAFAAIDVAAKFVLINKDSNAEEAEANLKDLTNEIREFLREK